MIPLAKPFFDEAEYLAVSEVLNSGMVSQGKKVEEFEEKVRKYVGAKYAVAVSSCTAGLYLALLAKEGMSYGRSWVTSAFTFPAINCVRNHLDYDGSPDLDLIDVDRNTYNMDISKLGYNYSTFIPIHQFGLPCNMDSIRELANEREAFVLEDAACALGSEYKGERIGKHGTTVFSFHGRKILTCGEGGMIVTDDEELYEAVLQGRQFGRNKKGQFSGTGLNFKMSDIQAAIGIAQMEKLPEILSLRSFVAKTYNDTFFMHTESDSLSSMRGMEIGLPSQIDYLHGDCKTNWQSYVVQLPKNINRDLIKDRMIEKGIEVQVGSYDNSNGTCKVSAELAKTTLALPIWPGMDETMIERVVTTLEEAMR